MTGAYSEKGRQEKARFSVARSLQLHRCCKTPRRTVFRRLWAAAAGEHRSMFFPDSTAEQVKAFHHPKAITHASRAATGRCWQHCEILNTTYGQQSLDSLFILPGDLIISLLGLRCLQAGTKLTSATDSIPHNNGG